MLGLFLAAFASLFAYIAIGDIQLLYRLKLALSMTYLLANIGRVNSATKLTWTYFILFHVGAYILIDYIMFVMYRLNMWPFITVDVCAYLIVRFCFHWLATRRVFNIICGFIGYSILHTIVYAFPISEPMQSVNNTFD
jgi:hypothetical protein